eukprot:scaffold938_cov399-Prasinococcus_capsulatus_cf.AAC.3
MLGGDARACAGRYCSHERERTCADSGARCIMQRPLGPTHSAARQYALLLQPRHSFHHARCCPRCSWKSDVRANASLPSPR